MLFEEGIGDVEEGNFLCRFLFDFVTEVSDPSEGEMPFLLESEEGPFDKFSPNFQCKLRFQFLLPRK